MSPCTIGGTASWNALRSRGERANGPIDYIASFIGYLGLATPNFLLALILLAYGAEFLDLPIGGLMAREFEGEPMSWDKLRSILAHLVVPTIVIGTSKLDGGEESLMVLLTAVPAK